VNGKEKSDMKRLTKLVVANPHVWWLLAIVTLNVILFWRGLVSDQWVVSKPGMDGWTQIYHSFSYVQEGLREGEFRTWNPYVFCGTPVLESFQYSVQYPFRWLFVFFPVPLGMNWMLFLHFCLAGTVMYGWVWFRTKSAIGAFTAGVVFMLCGSLFGRVPSGHFVLAYAIAWIPLVFWGIDGWCRQQRKRWLLLSAAGAALQMLASFPQYFYFTALTAGIYSLWPLAANTKKVKTAAGLLAIYPLAAAISAVVLIPGYLVAQEMVRAGGISVAAAASASMQFKDLLLIFVPNFYGTLGDWSYWDTEHIHEMWVYSGLGGLLLACAGWTQVSAGEKKRFLLLAMLALVLALGAYTPLFGVLREYVPLYSGFRSHGRWTIYFSLFVALLAGVGVSRIATGEQIPRGLAWGLLGLGAVFLLAGLLLYGDSLSDWYRNFADKLTFKPWFRQNLPFADRAVAAQGRSADALCWSGGLAVALGLILLLVKNPKRLTGWLVTVTVTDLMIFAAPLVMYFDKSEIAYSQLAEISKRFPPDTRNFNLVNPNANTSLKLEGLWAIDSVIFKRYVELIGASQGIAPGNVTQDIPVHHNTPIFKLLRGRYAFVPTKEGIKLAELHKDVLPRFLMVGNYKVLTDRDTILQTLAAPDFDFRRNVILETEPDFAVPSATAAPAYKVNVLSSSASRWVVEVETSAPGVLLMTDSYAKGWRARALAGSVQSDYKLQPADWAVRGIPLLVPGRHVLEIKYTPPGFALGLGVTLATLAALVVLALRALRGHFRRPALARAEESPPA
jgi:hypothetical protein